MNIDFVIKDILKSNNKPISDFKLIKEYSLDNGFDELETLSFINEYISSNIPIQYLVGYEYFLLDKIFVNNNVLIPRMETEEVVYKLYEEIINKYDNGSKLKILDLCTGSGVITIALNTLLKDKYDLDLYASDISLDAIDVAKKNFSYHNIGVNVFVGDLFENINVNDFDVIISNPPYIPYSDRIDISVYDNEPHIALFADDDGLFIYKRIIDEMFLYLKDDFIVCFEIGYNQAKKIKEYVKDIKNINFYDYYKDLNGNDRIFIIR